SGLCCSSRRIASSSIAERPTRTPGGVRNQYRIRDCPLPRRRALSTSVVVSYPRRSRLKRRCGRAYFLFCVRAVFLAAGFARLARGLAPRAAGAALRPALLAELDAVVLDGGAVLGVVPVRLTSLHGTFC